MYGKESGVLPTQKGAVLSTRTDKLVSKQVSGPLPDGSDLAGGLVSLQSVSDCVGSAKRDHADIPSINNLRHRAGTKWMDDPSHFGDCEIVSLGDHARSHVLVRDSVSITGDYAFVDDFIVQYGVDDPETADWLGEIPAGDALVHVYYLNWHFECRERPRAYVRAVLMLYRTAFNHSSVTSLMNNQLARRDEHMQALFGYIEHTISANGRWILREPEWRVPYMWSRDVRKHMRLQLSAASTPVASPEPLRPTYRDWETHWTLNRYV